MNAKDELNQALLVLRKYNLPISPILVCAIEELIDSLPKDQIKLLLSGKTGKGRNCVR